MALAVSWKPLVKSKANAATITTSTMSEKSMAALFRCRRRFDSNATDQQDALRSLSCDGSLNFR
ncbi:hypothetical protein Amsp01_102010 [Amycolatopsis sp. NBRC 101858]|nr:hypothetical protein Amsp01_102010 [Amycolatopsis sp. NBRC 101858]